MSAAIAAGGAFEEPTLSWLTAALKSSVGKKCVMGVTGLFLCFFLVVHLAGNLLLYVGAEQYNHYAHALHANPVVIRGAEFFLYLAFIVHIYLAITTHCENDAARGHGYAVKQTKRKDRTVNLFGWTPDTTMFVTGAIVLAFILIHVNDFSWNLFRPARELEPYDKAVHLLGNVTRGVVYLIGCLVLGVHVAHGFQSAFQSLGLNHPQFTCWIRKLSILFAFVVTIGFGSFVVWGLGKGGHVESTSTETAPAAPEEAPAHVHPHPHPEHDQK
ncbi:MAG: succinate dehydrogenase cytochrome b subunit [Planctomycetaceae bacterium]